MSNAPTAIKREQDNTIPIMHKTLTKFFLRVGNTSSAFLVQETADFHVTIQLPYHTFYFAGW